MREILLHRLVFTKTRHEGLRRTFVVIDLLLQLVNGFSGGGHFSFRFGNRGSLTGGALRFDLLFEVAEPRSRPLYRRVQIQILRCEPLLEIMQLLAQLRGAPFQICDGRIVLGDDEPLARRSGVPYRAQLSLGRSQFALGLIEGGGEAFRRGQQLVLVSLRRNDIVGRPECLHLLPFRRDLFVQGLGRVAQLVGGASRRFLVSSRQVFLVDTGQTIHQSRQELPLRALRAQQHHLGAFDGFRAEHALYAVDRIAPDISR